MSVRRSLSRIGHSLWRPWLKRRLHRLVVEEIDGLRLLVLPEVFHPLVFRSGSLLARTLGALPAAAGDQPPSLLDMGTGTGIGALFAARRGYRVVAVDINPLAARCARINALLNQLEDRIEVRQGDLFEPVGGDLFDLVSFNPPYFPGAPNSALDAAWRGEGVLELFAEGLHQVLAPGGRALLVLSTDGQCDRLLQRLRDRGYGLAVAAEERYATETLTAWWARPEAV